MGISTDLTLDGIKKLIIDIFNMKYIDLAFIGKKIDDEG
jgi:hypothetical protein